jgi:2',3'-cyclic-nucleotide 2'-phosphodiesterase (5'-nucleotidase family)
MDIQVSQKLTLQIGDEVFEITTQDAEKLYSQLFNLLGKHNQFQLSYPSGMRQFDPSMTYGVATNVALLAKGNE